MILTLNAHQMDSLRSACDAVASVTAIWTIAGIIPPIAGLFTITWFGMQIVLNWDKFIARLKQIADKGQR